MTRWTVADVPPQVGRTVLVTGANSGLGRHTATALAARGARVLMACRDPARASQAHRQVARRAARGGSAEFVLLDLADPASVRAAVADVRGRTDILDVLVNNAGVMATPLVRTVDGMEVQMATNHLGHAALTWLLMPLLRKADGARVVTVSSIAHRGSGLDIDDLNFTRRRYDKNRAYNQSKLANLLFALELDRRATAAGIDLTSVAAHPGLARTGLAVNTARAHRNRWLEAAARPAGIVVCQSAATGALPQLYAATMPDVRGGEYFGPRGLGELRGYPKRVSTAAAARDERLASRLWEITSALTGVTPDPA